MNEDQQLNDLLKRTTEPLMAGFEFQRLAEQNSLPAAASCLVTNFAQWQIGPNGTFRPTSQTRAELPAGAYSVVHDGLDPLEKVGGPRTHSIVMVTALLGQTRPPRKQESFPKASICHRPYQPAVEDFGGNVGEVNLDRQSITAVPGRKQLNDRGRTRMRHNHSRCNLHFLIAPGCCGSAGSKTKMPGLAALIVAVPEAISFPAARIDMTAVPETNVFGTMKWT